MKFHLDLQPEPHPVHITHADRLVLTGSCFSDQIGNKLKDHGFRTMVNPAGIAYNPVSLAQHLLGRPCMDEEVLFQKDGQWFSYLHHSSVRAAARASLVARINALNTQLGEALTCAKFLFLTLGSAFVYQLKTSKLLVANCHRQPPSFFEKRLLSPAEILNICEDLMRHLISINPSIKVVLTVSPVKHLRDGIHGNNLSKASLLLAQHALVEKFPFVSYFPAFELINDDLRDYRFYKEDLAHPNEIAIEYVWQHFCQVYFSDSTLKTCDLIGKYRKAAAHRVIDDSGSNELRHQKHLDTLRSDILRREPFVELG